MFTASQHPAALWKTWCLCLVSSSHLNLVNILHHDFQKSKHKMTFYEKHLFFRQGKSGASRQKCRTKGYFSRFPWYALIPPRSVTATYPLLSRNAAARRDLAPLWQ